MILLEVWEVREQNKSEFDCLAFLYSLYMYIPIINLLLFITLIRYIMDKQNIKIPKVLATFCKIGMNRVDDKNKICMLEDENEKLRELLRKEAYDLDIKRNTILALQNEIIQLKKRFEKHD